MAYIAVFKPFLFFIKKLEKISTQLLTVLIKSCII